MGVHGWRLLAGNFQTLIGTITKQEFNGGLEGDGDWSIFVQPDDPNDPLLSNRSGPGRTNQSRQIECEVEPSIDPTNDSDSFSASEDQYFSKLVGKRVKVWGPWVADCSHSWNDDSCLFGCCDEGKTEIHPIASLEVVISEPQDAKEVEIFVFSDASDTIKPPNAGENITANFAISFPTTPNDAIAPKFHLMSETNAASSVHFNIANDSNQSTLQSTVESGTVAESKGFYHAAIKIGFVFSSLKKNLAGRGDLSNGLRSLHPWFDAPTLSIRDVLESLD
jgi:hypothetical protein